MLKLAYYTGVKVALEKLALPKPLISKGLKTLGKAIGSKGLSTAEKAIGSKVLSTAEKAAPSVKSHLEGYLDSIMEKLHLI